MSLLFESIACRDGVLQNLHYHEKRMNASRSALLSSASPISLSETQIPKKATSGLWKCRVSYEHEIQKIDFSQYLPSQAKTYALIDAQLTYRYKYEDRQEIDELYHKKGQADDIIMVVDNFISDSSIGNLIFYDGKKWLTPDTPLLNGTMRAMLLDQNKIYEAKIRKSDLSGFTRFMVINALNPMDHERTLPISNIIF